MSNKPKLLLVLQLPPPVHGASIVNTYVESSAALRATFDVDVLPLRFADDIRDIGAVSLRKLRRALQTGYKLATRIHRQSPRAVYLTLSPVGGAFYRDCVYVAVMRALGAPRVFHMHGKGIAHPQVGWVKRRLIRWVLADADVILLSPLLRGEFESVVPASRLHYVANGIAPAQARPRRNHSDAPVHVVYVSNMRRDKGALDLLAAIVLLHEAGVPVRATFAGADAGDGTVPELEATVTRHEMSAFVKYVGPIYGEEKDALLDDADVFAFPTYYAQEAFPLVILEAMQRGLPVVSTHEGAIPEIVEHGVTGYLVAQRDVPALAHELERLLRDAPLRAKLGDEAQRRFRERYTIEQFEQRLVAVLETAVTRSQPRR